MFVENNIFGSLRSMVPGSHLISSDGKTSLHGLYIGSGKVLVFEPPPQEELGSGRVKKIDLRKFSAGGLVSKRKHINSINIDKEAEERALLCYENGHSPNVENDEDFCLWAITGVEKKADDGVLKLPKHIDVEISRPVIDGIIDPYKSRERVDENQEEKNDPIALGAHLVTPRNGYTHHGIYVGGGEVIHYSGLSDGLNAGPIEKVGIEGFSCGRKVWEREYKKPYYLGEDAVERAFSRIGEDDYDLHANNCEHFCSWVIMGRSRSKQVETAEDFIETSIPMPTINMLIKIRRHYKQRFDAKGLGQDIAEVGVKAIASSVVVGAWPAFAAYKVAKFFRKE